MLRNNTLPGIGRKMNHVLHLRGGIRNISGQDDDAYVAPGPRMLNGGHHYARSLGSFRNQFRICAAFLEKLFRMRGLEIFHAHLALRDVGGDGQHRSMVPVGVKQAVDQMEVAGAAAAAAYSQVPAQLGFRARSKCRRFLMPHMNPFNGLPPSQSVRNGVQAIPHNSVNSLNSRLFQNFNDLIGYPVHAA